MRTPRLALVLLAGLATTASASTQVHYVMGTFLRVVVDGDAPPSTFAPCFARARAFDRTFSRFDASSELVRLNAAGGGPASTAMRDAVERAGALAYATGGTFDVSAGAVTALWRAPVAPTAAMIDAARRTVGRVAVDGDRLVLGSGTLLDLDGFAKGLAVDACVDTLRAAGVTRALVSFGESSVYALGAPLDDVAWRLDVRGPDADRIVARLALRDGAASVSAVFGGARRRLPHGHGHVVDPRTGRALDEDVVGLVVADRAADAEAFSKEVLVRGPPGVVAVEAVDGVAAARLGRSAVALGDRMRAAGTLRVLARPRPVDGEVAFR